MFFYSYRTENLSECYFETTPFNLAKNKTSKYTISRSVLFLRGWISKYALFVAYLQEHIIVKQKNEQL